MCARHLTRLSSRIHTYLSARRVATHGTRVWAAGMLWCVQGLTDCLRAELAPQHIDVVLMQLGAVATVSDQACISSISVLARCASVCNGSRVRYLRVRYNPAVCSVCCMLRGIAQTQTQTWTKTGPVNCVLRHSNVTCRQWRVRFAQRVSLPPYPRLTHRQIPQLPSPLPAQLPRPLHPPPAQLHCLARSHTQARLTWTLCTQRRSRR